MEPESVARKELRFYVEGPGVGKEGSLQELRACKATELRRQQPGPALCRHPDELRLPCPICQFTVTGSHTGTGSMGKPSPVHSWCQCETP